LSREERAFTVVVIVIVVVVVARERERRQWTWQGGEERGHAGVCVKRGRRDEGREERERES
jgi:hypothetical protein